MRLMVGSWPTAQAGPGRWARAPGWRCGERCACGRCTLVCQREQCSERAGRAARPRGRWAGGWGRCAAVTMRRACGCPHSLILSAAFSAVSRERARVGRGSHGGRAGERGGRGGRAVGAARRARVAVAGPAGGGGGAGVVGGGGGVRAVGGRSCVGIVGVLPGCRQAAGIAPAARDGGHACGRARGGRDEHARRAACEATRRLSTRGSRPALRARAAPASHAALDALPPRAPTWGGRVLYQRPNSPTKSARRKSRLAPRVILCRLDDAAGRRCSPSRHIPTFFAARGVTGRSSRGLDSDRLDIGLAATASLAAPPAFAIMFWAHIYSIVGRSRSRTGGGS
jgi:hypothetical protein